MGYEPSFMVRAAAGRSYHGCSSCIQSASDQVSRAPAVDACCSLLFVNMPTPELAADLGQPKPCSSLVRAASCAEATTAAAAAPARCQTSTSSTGASAGPVCAATIWPLQETFPDLSAVKGSGDAVKAAAGMTVTGRQQDSGT